MKFKIDSAIFKKFPGLNIGVVVARDVNNGGEAEKIQNSLRQQERRIREELNLETLPQHPRIDVWRKTYIAFGAKPKEHRSSVENLYRLVLGGVNLRSINKLVDIYNYISLKHLLPVGGEDLDKVQGDINLTFAGVNEPAVLLLGDKDLRPPHQGEVIYKDKLGAICRRWNWREADRTKLTGETKNCILVIEGLPPITKEEVKAATSELKELVEEFCGGKVTRTVLDQDYQEVKC